MGVGYFVSARKVTKYRDQTESGLSPYSFLATSGRPGPFCPTSKVREHNLHSSHLLGSSIFSQLLMLHEEVLPVSESFPDLVPFVDSLDFEGSNVLYGCDGQGTMLQHELNHFMAFAKQSIIKGCVPEADGGFFFFCKNGM